VTIGDRWLRAVWPFVRAQLPAAPAAVAEIGCGQDGGFVPMLRSVGYEAVGIDPEAPAGSWYRQVEFERCENEPVAAVVACTSLHHVSDVDDVLDRIHLALAPGGVLVVVEWARERFDEATAKWCQERLPQPGGDQGWLGERCAEWRDSGRPWHEYIRSWAEAEGLHEGRAILGGLAARFDARTLGYGPYYFPDLADISEADEQAAIDSGLIQAARIQYAGSRRPSCQEGT
jgi:SAM-dependent methyltransferase